MDNHKVGRFLVGHSVFWIESD